VFVEAWKHTFDLDVKTVEVGLIIFGVDLAVIYTVVRLFHVVNYQLPLSSSFVDVDADARV